MKTILAIVSLLSILVSTAFAETVIESEASGKCEFYTKMQKEMTNASKRGEYYTKKADTAKQVDQVDLAAAYEECSTAKIDIANSIKDFLSASDIIHTECNLNNETSKEIKEIFAYKKGERLTTKIKSVTALKEKLQATPVAIGNEKGEVQQDNKKLSEEIDVINSSLEKYIAGQKQLKIALVKVKTLSKSVKEN
jgi:hypothetical protein